MEAALIKATDPTLDAALKKLRNNPQLGPLIIEMEAAGFQVNIEPGPAGRTSGMAKNGPLIYDVIINSKEDDAVARAMFGVVGTNEENSIAHELGHVFFEYLYVEVKKKPLVMPPGWTITRELFMEGCSETYARQWDNRTRPPGVMIPVKSSVPIPPPTILNWMRSAFSPLP
jgi:hypothetical protein